MPGYRKRKSKQKHGPHVSLLNSSGRRDQRNDHDEPDRKKKKPDHNYIVIDQCRLLGLIGF